MQRDEDIRMYFDTLYGAWGRQHWWPAQSAFEVVVGAYLTQNTSWTNVERALSNMRKARILSIQGIRRTPLHKLERLIRSAGYFRQKARRLKTFVRFLDERYGGSLARMFREPTALLREELLALNGIGPETADSILLYAGNHPVFVVDAYTRRIIERHELVHARASYEEIRALFEGALAPLAERLFEAEKVLEVTRGSQPQLDARLDPRTNPASRTNGMADQRGASHPPSRMSLAKRTAAAQVFNEMHGLIVGVGKNFCKKSQPECERCPLRKFLPGAK
ncbi:MAG: hypothetical protein WBS24_08685 [Terriglobales bacterium]